MGSCMCSATNDVTTTSQSSGQNEISHSSPNIVIAPQDATQNNDVLDNEAIDRLIEDDALDARFSLNQECSDSYDRPFEPANVEPYYNVPPYENDYNAPITMLSHRSDYNANIYYFYQPDYNDIMQEPNPNNQSLSEISVSSSMKISDKNANLDAQMITEIEEIVEQIITPSQQDAKTNISRCPGSTDSSNTGNNKAGNNNKNSNNKRSYQNNNGTYTGNEHNYFGSQRSGGDGDRDKDKNNDDEKKSDDLSDDDDEEEEEEEQKEEESKEEEKELNGKKQEQHIKISSKLELNPNAPDFISSRLSTIHEYPRLIQSAPNPKFSHSNKKQRRRKPNISGNRVLTNEYYYTQYTKKKEKNNKKCAKFRPSKQLLAEGNIMIPRTFTSKKVPTLIHENITDVYQYMNVSTSLQQNEYNDGEIRIFDFDFHSINGNDKLYCVASRQDENKKNNRGFKWIMIDELFTGDYIKSMYNVTESMLSTSVRLNKEFQFCVNSQHITEIHKTIDSENVISTTDWKTVPVYCKDAKQRNCRVELKLTIQQFKSKVVPKKNKKIVPILMFRNDQICVQYIWIVSIVNNSSNGNHMSTDIGIAFEYNENHDEHVKVAGIHLDKKKMINNHELLFPSPKNIMDDLNDFQANYNDLCIGNVDAVENTLKHKEHDISSLKRENNILMKENQNLKGENKAMSEKCKEKDIEIDKWKLKYMMLREEMMRCQQPESPDNGNVSLSSSTYAVNSSTSSSISDSTNQ